jgi:tetratricopeptide (TPR) repeat protein
MSMYSSWSSHVKMLMLMSIPRCPEHPGETLSPRKLGWHCPACDDSVLSYEHCPRESPPAAPSREADLKRLPFPVAYPLAYARDLRLPPGDRVDNLIFTAYQAMRTATLVLLADYFACKIIARDLAGPMRGLRMPHWGEWQSLAARLVLFWQRELAEKPERESLVPALCAGWKEVGQVGKGLTLDTRWRGMLARLDGLQGPARSANDAIQKLRNDRAHRAATKTLEASSDIAAIQQLGPLVEEVVRVLFPEGALQLYRRVPGENPPAMFRLEGPHEDFRFAPIPSHPSWEEAFELSDILAVAGNHVLPLFPLCIPQPIAGLLSGCGLSEPAVLIDGIKENTVVLIGVRSHYETSTLVEPVRQRFDAKQVDLTLDANETTPWTVADRARMTARECLSVLLGRKYFPECYVERKGIDSVVDRILDVPGKALLLLGDAGSGKSSLLSRLVERLTAEDLNAARFSKNELREVHAGELPLGKYFVDRGQGDVILFLSGRADFLGDRGEIAAQILVNSVLRKAGVREGAFGSLEKFVARLNERTKQDQNQERRVLLVLDALNEADRYADLVEALNAFLPCIARYRWLRLVVSMRSGSFHALARRGESLQQVGGVLSNESYLFEHLNEDGKLCPYLELRPFRMEPEGREAYKRRQSALPGRASTTPWSTLAPEQRKLLLSPLRLHLFHETYRGCEAPAGSGTERALFDAYLDQLVREVPGLGGTLQRVGAWMFEQCRPDLPLAVADDWVATWRAQHGFASAALVARLDPVEELVAASVLMRPAEDGFGVDRKFVGFQFAHQKLCESVLARELRRRIAPRVLPTGDELLAWARHAAGPKLRDHDEFAELMGALEGVAALLAEEGQCEVLAALLQLEDEPARTKILGAALRALGPVWGKSEEGEAKAAASLAGLLAEAKRSLVVGEWWVASCSSARNWLAHAGFSIVASKIDHGCVDVLRRSVEVEPHRADLRRDLSVSLRHLGGLARDAGRTEDAIGFFEESLAISRRLADVEPHRTDLQQELSASMVDLGRVTLDVGRSEEAIRLFEASTAVLRQLLEAEPHCVDLQQDLSASLLDLGQLVRSVGRSEEARRIFEESNTICRRFVEAEPHRADLQQYLLVSLGHLGSLARDAGRSEEARRIFEESNTICHRLLEAEPHRTDLQENLSISLTDLGRVARDSGRSEDAMGFFEESLAIHRRLADAEPHRTDLQQELSVSLRLLGLVASDAGRSEEARRIFEESNTICRRLVEAEPHRADLQRHLSASLGHLGSIARDAGRSEDAMGFFEESLAIHRRLLEAEPHRTDLQENLSISLNDLGRVARDAGRSEEAMKFFEENLAIARRLAEVEPHRADFQQGLSISLICLGQLVSSVGHSEEARGLFEESNTICRRLVEAEPHRADLQQYLSASLGHLGSIARDAGRSEDAMGFFEESLAIRRRLADAEPHRADLQENLSVLLGHLGSLSIDVGRSEDARRFLEESIAIDRRLLEAEPQRTDLQEGLSTSLNNLGRVARNAGRNEEAMRLFEENLSLARRLMEAELGRVDLCVNVAITYRDLFLTTTDKAEQRRWLTEAVSTLQSMCDAGAQDTRLDKVWAEVSAALKTL